MSQTEAPTPFAGDSGAEIARARNGCQVTMGKLLDEIRAYLHTVAACGIDTDIRGKLSASDLVQETLLDAHRNFQAFNGQNSVQLKAWIRRILINNLINHYRRLRDTKKRDVSREKNDFQVDELVTKEAETPSQVAIEREEQLMLDQEMAQLPESYRHVILLRHREQLTFAEIAERLGKSGDAARMIWYRAFDQLSKAIDKRIG